MLQNLAPEDLEDLGTLFRELKVNKGDVLFRKGSEGTANTTRSMEMGMKDKSSPTNLAGISMARAKRTKAWPAIHCQETTFMAVKSRNSLDGKGNSRIAEKDWAHSNSKERI